MVFAWIRSAASAPFDVSCYVDQGERIHWTSMPKFEMGPKRTHFDITPRMARHRIQPSFDPLIAVEVKVAGLLHKQHFSLNPGGAAPSGYGGLPAIICQEATWHH